MSIRQSSPMRRQQSIVSEQARDGDRRAASQRTAA